MKNEQIIQLLKIVAQHDLNDCLWWNTDLEFSVECNDQFYWATCDAEEITNSDDILLLKECLKESEYYGPLLYCCRKRGMRPQNAAYKYIDKEEWAIFDSCGPEREINFFNPYKLEDRGK